MVLYINIAVGQHVIVKSHGKLIPAVVRFKGYLNGQPGRWIGVELEYPVGTHNGCWKGNQYFKCPNKHGLFTHACNIGFPSMSRKSKNFYKTKDSDSVVEEELFGPVQSISGPQRSRCISREYLETVKSYAQEGKRIGYKWSKETSYNKSHLVGNYIPCATISKEEPKEAKTYQKRPDYFLSLNASIPHYTMPHEFQLECLKKGKFNDKSFKQPRFLSV